MTGAAGYIRHWLRVEIIFEALPGPGSKANYDWDGWSMPVLIDETLPDEPGTGLTGYR